MSLNTEAARSQMVSQQIRAGDVLDPAVLKILGEVPRERFAPAAYRTLAFADAAIPLPHGQAMLTPQVEGRILQALEIGAADRVLEVGTGSGFLTACLGRMAGHVTSLEIIPELAERAAPQAAGPAFQQLRGADTGRLPVATGRAFQLHCRNRVAAGPRCSLPGLAGARRRLFVTVGEAPAMEAWLIRREAGAFARECLFETVLPALQNAPQPEPFTF